MRILVVDDSENARGVAEVTLLSGGYDDVSFAESGADALQLLASLIDPGPAFDVILMDFMMPGMDGVQTCAEIRKDGRYADVPIIMVTSISDQDSMSQAFVAGATDYVTKPFQRVELLARVRSALTLKGERDRRRARESELQDVSGEPEGEGLAAAIDPALAMPGRDFADALLRALGAEASGAEMSVLCVQIDHFSRYRDQYRAGAGALLRMAAAALGAAPARLDATLTSYNEGAFVLICPGMTARAAAGLADDLRQRVEALGEPHRDSPTAAVVTASVGFASGPVSGAATPRRLLSGAITAAEKAADLGGNRVVPANLEPVG